MSILGALVAVVLLFGLTIFIHELGHFMVARWCGLVAETFSIGFGPAIWKKKVNGVTYKIGCLPFGGYVSLPQMEPAGSDAKKEPPREGEEPRPVYPPVSPWKRMLVAAAGAICNMLLAVVIAYVIYAVARPSDEQADRPRNRIGYVETNTVAYAEGLRPGDAILSVNGEAVTSWDDFVLGGSLAARVTLEVQPADGAARTLELPTEEWVAGGRGVKGVYRSMPALVIGVRAGSSAEAAGVQRGDRIRDFDGLPVYSIDQLIDLVGQRAEQSVPMIVEREGADVALTVTPRFDEAAQRALIGVEFNVIDLSLKPMQQVRAWGSPVFRILRALVTPKESSHAARSLGGPLAIIKMYWLAARTSFLLALWITGMLNINLAILNLLPIPVLDGGHIVLSLFEGVTRRPVNARVVGFLYQVFFVLLISAFLFLTYRDTMTQILPMFRKDKTEAVEAPPAELSAEDDSVAVPAPEAATP